MTRKKKNQSSAAPQAKQTGKKNTTARSSASGSSKTAKAKTKATAKSGTQTSGGKSKTTPKQTPPKRTTSPIGAAAPEKQSEKKVNAWRDEPGTDQPLRVGRGVRTRDEYFKGQKGKSIHLEQHPDELYRRTVVLEIDDDENLLLVQIKRPNSHRGELVPYDKKGRKYIQDPLTLDDNDEPIRIKKGKFELAPYGEDVREDQANQMSEDTENKSNENKKRFSLFRKNKK